MSDDDLITLIVATDSTSGSKSAWGDRAVASIQQNVTELKESLATEVRKLGRMMEGLEGAVGAYRCEEVELSLEATTEGGFRLVGAVQASAGATITLRFQRQEP